jgi:uncharacterized protein
MYTFKGESINKGNMRETFFVNQLKYKHTIELSDTADFIVNRKYSFEIGGRTKNKKQIANLHDAFIVTDNTEFGFGNKIPLWLFGFLY